MSFIDGERYDVKEQLRGTITSDLSVSVFLKDREYDIRVDSSEAMNDLGTLQMVARAMGVTLQNMMSQPDAEIKSVSIVSLAEERELIELGTGELLEYDESKTMVDLLRQQAAATPDAIAVVYQAKR